MRNAYYSDSSNLNLQAMRQEALKRANSRRDHESTLLHFHKSTERCQLSDRHEYYRPGAEAPVVYNQGVVPKDFLHYQRCPCGEHLREIEARMDKEAEAVADQATPTP